MFRKTLKLCTVELELELGLDFLQHSSHMDICHLSYDSFRGTPRHASVAFSSFLLHFVVDSVFS